MQNIKVGDLIEGTDVTMRHDVVGTVVDVLYGTGLGYYTSDVTHARGGCERRYIVLPLDPEAREVIVENAHGYVATPVERADSQAAADTYAAKRSPATFRAMRDACRAGLTPGEMRAVTVGNASVRVFAVCGGGFTRVDARRGGELLMAYSGTHPFEGDALRQFADVVALIAPMQR